MEIAYKNWKKKAGVPVMVKKIEFLTYHKPKNSSYRTVIKENGKKYIGEVWKCEVFSTGEIENFVFKEEVIDEGNIGWNYSKPHECPIDYWTNPLVDDYNVVIGKKLRSQTKNKGLENFKEYHDKLVYGLEMIIENHRNERVIQAAERRLQFITTPTLENKLMYFDKTSKRYKNLVQKELEEVYL